MKESLKLEGTSLRETEYRDILDKLDSNGYSFIIDPRQFDSPIKVNARFKPKGRKEELKKIRFCEFSPQLELSIEHDTNKREAKVKLNSVKRDLEEALKSWEAKVDDYELATLEIITRRNPIIVPKSDLEVKLFRGLEEKNIFSRAMRMECPECGQIFMLPSKDLKMETKRAFCSDCKVWFPIKSNEEAYIVNEEYLKVVGGIWDKVQTLVRTSWREIVKKGIPKLPIKEKKTKKK